MMKTSLIYLIIILLLGFRQECSLQTLPQNVCEVRDGSLYFHLNRQWSENQLNEFIRKFNFDSAFVHHLMAGIPLDSSGINQWNIQLSGDNLIELSKSFQSSTSPALQDNFIFDLNNLVHIPDINIRSVPAVPQIFTSNLSQPVNYGLNSNKRADIFAYANRIATFFLPEYKDAKQVILSGSFNNWSTMQMPMEKTDSGWVFSLPLAPGKHLYKYIVDGRWMHDQLNDLHEDDGNNGFNSIVYCYNFCFHLNGFTNAKKVYITGSFINWQRKQLRMIRSVGGWQLPIYLREGTHAYKFIVDNEWINDPDNTIVRPDGHGNFNSFLGIGDSVVFRLQGYNNAREVKLAGDFNAWNPEELLMTKTVNGWELPYALGAGNFEYKFIVDGTWMPDPDNPHRRGKGMYENSVLTNKPNFMFELDGYPEAKQVIVTGSFNGWQTDNFVMERKESKWTYSLFLKPGKHLYKFIVDGVWILDPANDLWEDNAEGTGNSILWIE